MNSNFDNIELPLVQVPVWSLKTGEFFKNLFPIQDTVLSDIIDDMTVNGFDAGHPIVVWNMMVVDGHTRLKAAVATGLDTVPVICRQFDDEDEALEYAIKAQSCRRNLTDYELLQCLQRLDWKKIRGRPKKTMMGNRENQQIMLLKRLEYQERRLNVSGQLVSMRPRKRRKNFASVSIRSTKHSRKRCGRVVQR